MSCWHHDYETDADFTSAYMQECRDVRTGMAPDISKCLSEGKAVIVCGTHVLPSLYSTLLPPHGTATVTGTLNNLTASLGIRTDEDK